MKIIELFRAGHEVVRLKKWNPAAYMTLHVIKEADGRKFLGPWGQIVDRHGNKACNNAENARIAHLVLADERDDWEPFTGEVLPADGPVFDPSK